MKCKIIILGILLTRYFQLYIQYIEIRQYKTRYKTYYIFAKYSLNTNNNNENYAGYTYTFMLGYRLK